MKKVRSVTGFGSSAFRGKLIFALLVTIGSTILVASGVAGIAAGQNKQGKVEYGVTYACPQMNNYEFKVLSCDDQDWCQVFIANKFSPGGGNVTGQGKDSVLS